MGKKLLVYLNADDMRSVRAFTTDGAELGVLMAQGAWGVVAHNLKLRQEIIKLRGAKRMRAAINQNLIEQYIQTKLSQAKKKRSAATSLSNALRTLANAPTLRTPPGPLSPAQVAHPVISPSDDAASPAPESTADKTAHPHRLNIGTGHSF